MSVFAVMVRAVYGCWRLARRDPSGFDWIESSPRGVVTSFWGPALVLPGVLALQAIDGTFADAILRPLLVLVIGYVIGCAAYPLMVLRITDDMGRGALCYRYIAAYNWSSVIQIAVLLPMALLTWLFPHPALALVSLAVSVALLFYQAYIAQTALMVPPVTAVLLVVLDVLLGTMIQTVAERLAV